MASHSMLTGFLGLFIARRKLWTVGVKAGMVWNFLLLKGQKNHMRAASTRGGLLGGGPPPSSGRVGDDP